MTLVLADGEAGLRGGFLGHLVISCCRRVVLSWMDGWTKSANQSPAIEIWACKLSVGRLTQGIFFFSLPPRRTNFVRHVVRVSDGEGGGSLGRCLVLLTLLRVGPGECLSTPDGGWPLPRRYTADHADLTMKLITTKISRKSAEHQFVDILDVARL